MALTRKPNIGERVRFPPSRASPKGALLVVQHYCGLNGAIAVCKDERGDWNWFIAQFADGQFNTEAEIVEARCTCAPERDAGMKKLNETGHCFTCGRDTSAQGEGD